MLLKKPSLIILTLFFISSLYATEPLTVSSKITAAIVYPNGAMITRTVELNSSGLQTLKLKGLPLGIDVNKTIVEADNSLEIISINSKIKYKDENRDVSAFQINNNKRIVINDSIAKEKAILESLNLEEEMILDNNEFYNEDDSSNIDAVIQASSFYSSRLKEIKLQKLEVEIRMRALNQSISKLISESTELNKKYQDQETELCIIVNNSNAKTSSLQISYFLEEASWYPYYDLRVKAKQEKISLHRKAYVSQWTGEEWKDVKLTLSNSDPSESTTLPIIIPKKLKGIRSVTDSYNSNAKVYGLVTDLSGEALVGANIFVQGSNQSCVTDIDGNFEFPKAINKLAIVTYVGYTNKTVFLAPGFNHIVLGESVALDEIVATSAGASLQDNDISVRGSRSDITYYYVDGIRVNSLDAHRMMPKARTSIKTARYNTLNTVEYKVKEPYTIFSNRDKVDVLLEIDSMSAIFEYFSVPKKSKKAFLIAKIPEWHSHDLLRGNANLFLDNSFRGTTLIDPESTQDTLDVSLGADSKIVIEYDLLTDHYKKSFTGKKVKENFVYQFRVTNQKDYPVKIKIHDQVPISEHKDIKIELKKSEQAKFYKTEGILEWELQLVSGVVESRMFHYEVKYPKNYKLNL